jgi:hypothetical protein
MSLCSHEFILAKGGSAMERQIVHNRIIILICSTHKKKNGLEITMKGKKSFIDNFLVLDFFSLKKMKWNDAKQIIQKLIKID